MTVEELKAELARVKEELRAFQVPLCVALPTCCERRASCRTGRTRLASSAHCGCHLDVLAVLPIRVLLAMLAILAMLGVKRARVRLVNHIHAVVSCARERRSIGEAMSDARAMPMDARVPRTCQNSCCYMHIDIIHAKTVYNTYVGHAGDTTSSSPFLSFAGVDQQQLHPSHLCNRLRPNFFNHM